jgi:hypothetical protein
MRARIGPELVPGDIDAVDVIGFSIVGNGGGINRHVQDR